MYMACVYVSMCYMCMCVHVSVMIYVCLYVHMFVHVCACVLYMCMREHVVYMSLQQKKLVVMSKHIAIGTTLCDTF